MAVRIRLSRVGNKNNPFYRIAVTNQGDPNNGKAIELLGTYDPKGGGKAVLKKDRYAYWIGVGAIPSDTVNSLVSRAVDYEVEHPAKAETSAEAPAETPDDTPEEAPAEEASTEDAPEKEEPAAAE